MDDNKLQTPAAQKRDIQELHSDIEVDEVQEVERSSFKKLVHLHLNLHTG